MDRDSKKKARCHSQGQIRAQMVRGTTARNRTGKNAKTVHTKKKKGGSTRKKNQNVSRWEGKKQEGGERLNEQWEMGKKSEFFFQKNGATAT